MADASAQRQSSSRAAPPASVRRTAPARRATGDARRMAGTALSSGNSLSGFGVAAVRRAPGRAGRVSNLVLVAEIRRRIPEFVAGRHFPKKFQDFLDYLTSRKLSLETRVDGLGNRANYVVDQTSGRSVAAADVDHRLSVAGIAKAFGVNFEKKAAEKYETLSDEQKRAIQVRRKNAGRLLDRSAGLPFRGWDDMTFSAPMLLDGEVSAFGEEVWVGPEFARASADPAENRRLVERARAEGVRIVPPARSRDDALAGRFVAGMPLLVADKAVRLRLVDADLTHVALSKAFGGTLFQHFEELAKKAPKPAVGTKPAETSAAEFLKKFGTRRRREDAEGIVFHDRITILHEALEDGGERLEVVHPDGSRQVFDPRRMQPGRYRKEDPYGLPGGLVEIRKDGFAYAHLDNDGRPHNEVGPAVVSLRGESLAKPYALKGRTMDEASFREAIVASLPPVHVHAEEAARMSA